MATSVYDMLQPPGSRHTPAGSSRAPGHASGRSNTSPSSGWRRAGAPVLPEELFHDALARERHRSDRFEERFVLLLVSLSEVPESARQHVTASVIAGMRALTQKPNVIGWFAEGQTLGLIVPQAAVSPEIEGDQLCRLLTNELTQRIEPESRAMISICAATQEGSDGTTRTGMGSPLRVRPEVPSLARALLRDGMKRILDIAGSLALLLASSPVLLIAGAAVKLTSAGPILFRQERIGQARRRFTMLKFRTMYVHADKAIHQQYVTQLIHGNAAAAGSGDQAIFKITNDPRVTPVGRFLRKTSMDELPQFWNVLRGEMSLVGPRPPLPYEVEEYRPWHYRRILEAKPGITGLWQVAGRSRTTFDEMVRLDLRYARTRSLWTDLKILLATPRAVISGKGAC